MVINIFLEASSHDIEIFLTTRQKTHIQISLNQRRYQIHGKRSHSCYQCCGIAHELFMNKISHMNCL